MAITAQFLSQCTKAQINKGVFVEIPATKKSLSKRKLILGVGSNDANYLAERLINGRRAVCPYYVRWKDMLKRCYSEKSQKQKPTYIECSVAKEWLIFSNFRKWMEDQDWVGMHLDKDVKYQGNKVYSPDSCLFIPQDVNKLLSSSKASRGEYPLGVCWNKRQGRFISSISIKGKNVFIGYFDCPSEAHDEYKKAKYAEINRVASTQKEPLKSYLLAYKILD